MEMKPFRPDIEKLTSGLKNVLVNVKEPDLILCVSPRALFITSVIHSHFGGRPEVQYDDSLKSDPDNIQKIARASGMLAGEERRILVVDFLCEAKNKIEISNVETLTLCVSENSVYVPTYTCFKTSPSRPIVLPWEA